jgi:putative hemolysin
MGETRGRSIRVDDDVWRDFCARKGTQNEVLRELLGKSNTLSYSPDGRVDEILELVRGMVGAEEVYEAVQRALDDWANPKKAVLDTAPVSPASIPGVQVGIGVPKNARCEHCGRMFSGRKGATLCRACSEAGHAGDVRECGACAERDGAAI